MVSRCSKNYLRINLVLGFLLTSFPSWAATFYVDYVGGADTNNGISTGTPFKHSPGDPAATGNAVKTLAAGDTVVFKRGVSYLSTITAGTSGAVLVSRSTASVSSGGVLTDTGANFTTAGVTTTNFIYIYHSKSSQAGTWVTSAGVYPIASVNSTTQLTLSGYTGPGHATAEMTYIITKPVHYTSIDSWGTGYATFDGENTRNSPINLNGKNYLRFSNLRLYNTAGAADTGAINGTADGTQVDNCTFDTTRYHGIVAYGSYTVVKNSTFLSNGATTLISSAYNSYVLYDNNYVDGGTRTLMGGRWLVIRNNTIKNISGALGGHADSIGFIDGGPNNNNDYGWIYGNTIDDFVEGIALYEGGGNSTHYWTVHSNLIIGRRWQTGHGDSAIVCQTCVGNIIANNTIVSSSATQFGYGQALNLEINSTNTVVKNNIIHNPGDDSALILYQSNGSGNIIDYNHYYSTASTGPFRTPTLGTKISYAAWKGLGFDAHSPVNITTAPLFVSFPTNFHLAAGSSYDIDTGTTISQFNIDKGGASRPQGTAWDIGAYEYSGGGVGRIPSYPNIIISP